MCLTVNVRADSTPASTAVKPLAEDARKVFSPRRITIDLFGVNQTDDVIGIIFRLSNDRGKLVAMFEYDGPPSLSISEDSRNRRALTRIIHDQRRVRGASRYPLVRYVGKSMVSQGTLCAASDTTCATHHMNKADFTHPT